jgi:hypothetical protein
MRFFFTYKTVMPARGVTQPIMKIARLTVNSIFPLKYNNIQGSQEKIMERNTRAKK